MPTRTKSRRPSAGRRRPAALKENPDFSGIHELAASLNALHRQMAAACAPGVQEMIRSRTRDQRQIEHMLDRLLDCACILEGLALFRALCRYYLIPLKNPRSCIIRMRTRRDTLGGGERVTADVGFEQGSADEV